MDASEQPRRFDEMTWEEVRDLDRSGVVVILPIGAVEAHGPHLPLGTDTVIAEGMAREAVTALALSGMAALVLPPIWTTSAGFAEAFPGTVGVRPTTVTRLLLDVVQSLAAQGFETVALANAHLDPDHLASLQAVVDAAPAEITVVFPNLVRRRNVERLGDEFATGACHAGRFEGSMVRAERPDLFRAEQAASLEPNPSSLSVAIGRGDRSFEEAGGARAYFGWPAEATAEEGRARIAELGAILAEAVLEAAQDRPDPSMPSQSSDRTEGGDRS